jgi:hypothetical protein
MRSQTGLKLRSQSFLHIYGLSGWFAARWLCAAAAPTGAALGAHALGIALRVERAGM